MSEAKPDKPVEDDPVDDAEVSRVAAPQIGETSSTCLLSRSYAANAVAVAADTNTFWLKAPLSFVATLLVEHRT